MAFKEIQCWYEINNDKFNVKSDEIKNHGIYIDQCVSCKYSIISQSYQQSGCGSRYCTDCYSKIKPKYYCQLCVVDDPNNFIHKKEEIFEDRAFMNDLLKMKPLCPDCRNELSILDFEKHARDECTQGWKMCDKCEKMHKKLSKHECNYYDDLSPYKKPCQSCSKECTGVEKHECKMNWESACPYDCKKEKFDENHRKEAALQHLDKMWAVFKELKITDCKKADDSPGYGAWYDRTIDQMKSALQFDNSSVQNLRIELDSLNKEMAEEKNIHEQIITNLLNQASEFLNTSFDGTIMWRLDRFSKLKEDAIKGTQIRVFSQPFYTSRFGYKMCLLLYPNGDSNVNGKAISLFLVIMKGNYDAMLRWPFQQKVTFTLLDQNLRTNLNHSFFPSVTLPSFSFPKTDMNIPAGISSFIKFEDLHKIKDSYIKDDTVFIQCTVDCSDLHE